MMDANAAYELKHFIDWHLEESTLIDGDCGCAEEEAQEWQDRMKIIGAQAFNDHVYEGIKRIVEGGVSWRSE